MGISQAIKTSSPRAAGRSLPRLSFRSGFFYEQREHLSSPWSGCSRGWPAGLGIALKYLRPRLTPLISALIVGLGIFAAAPVLVRPPDVRSQP